MIDQLQYHYDLPPYAATPEAAHAALASLLEASACQALLITSQDEFLTEYLPHRDNQRYALSAFDGSAGSGIFLRTAIAHRLNLPQFVLFVDGRYHLQADAQCDPRLVHVEKLTLGVPMWRAIANWLTAHADTLGVIGYDARRLSVAQHGELLKAAPTLSWSAVDGHAIDRAIGLPGWHVQRPIFELPETMTGLSTRQNIARLNQSLCQQIGDEAAKTCFITCMADDLSYLLNSRGYHQPNASSHLGVLFVIGEQVVLFLPESCAQSPVTLPGYTPLEVVRGDVNQLERFLAAFEADYICFDPNALNCALLALASRLWPAARRIDARPVETQRVRKTPVVLDQFRDAFARSSAAIAQTMRWAKYGEPGITHSEYDLARKINDAYAERGAVGLSFTSISANGANSAQAHYSEARQDVPLTEGELVLLDSGAYYEGGFATDCTRVVLRKTNERTQAQPWQRKIYTVTLKACIKGMTTHFAADAKGEDVDRAVRAVCNEHGYDFNHGTGHGVGIHVHENGIRFAAGSKYGLTPSAIASIEPGIYLPGQGGVRIENIVIVHESQEAGKMAFENIVTVGYDWDLIDLDMLNESERDHLREYERLCAKLGTQVTPCPLLS